MLFDQSLQNSFVKDIEKYVSDDMGDYIEATLTMCEKYEIEPQIAAKFLTKPIIEKIQKEGESGNLLPKKSKLPI